MHRMRYATIFNLQSVASFPHLYVIACDARYVYLASHNGAFLGPPPKSQYPYWRVVYIPRANMDPASSKDRFIERVTQKFSSSPKHVYSSKDLAVMFEEL